MRPFLGPGNGGQKCEGRLLALTLLSAVFGPGTWAHSCAQFAGQTRVSAGTTRQRQAEPLAGCSPAPRAPPSPSPAAQTGAPRLPAAVLCCLCPGGGGRGGSTGRREHAADESGHICRAWGPGAGAEAVRVPRCVRAGLSQPGGTHLGRMHASPAPDRIRPAPPAQQPAVPIARHVRNHFSPDDIHFLQACV